MPRDEALLRHMLDYAGEALSLAKTTAREEYEQNRPLQLALDNSGRLWLTVVEELPPLIEQLRAVLR